MRVFLLIALCAVASKFVVAEGENELKRGAFPFMAFVYFPDETVLDAKGLRLTRVAVLIRPHWLITSSLETVDTALAFPQKTLLARLGATSIDENLNLNEDEGEQEREVILILRPYNFSRTEWWQDDVSLLKTLLPFNITASVASMVHNQPNKRDISEQTCFIMLYAKRLNATERTLMQLAVELLPPTQESCGGNFRKETMACANNSDDKFKELDPNFCEGNNGGPLMCDNEVTGLQTYINDCQQPHLYQLLATRENLISCATEEKYEEDTCALICSIVRKDPLTSPTPDNLYASSDTAATESIIFDKQSSHEATLTSLIVTEEENIPVSESETPQPTMTEITTKEITNATTVMTSTYSHDTTSVASSEIYANSDEETIDPAVERDRKANVEAHQIVRSEAPPKTLSVYSFIFLKLTLVYLT